MTNKDTMDDNVDESCRLKTKAVAASKKSPPSIGSPTAKYYDDVSVSKNVSRSDDVSYIENPIPR